MKLGPRLSVLCAFRGGSLLEFCFSLLYIYHIGYTFGCRNFSHRWFPEYRVQKLRANSRARGNCQQIQKRFINVEHTMVFVQIEPNLSRAGSNIRSEIDESRDAQTSRAERLARRNSLRRRIKLLCIVMLITYCVRFVLTVTVWNVSDSSFTIPFSLGVAYCGLVGAARMNKDTLSCFYFCCLASLCLYVANVLVQTKMVIDVRNGEEVHGETESTQDVYLVVITAIGMETFLAFIQVIGALYGRELVHKHLVVRHDDARPHMFSGNAFSLEFIQQQQNQSRSAADFAASLTESLNTKMTIESIPVRMYQKGIPPESFPVTSTTTLSPSVELCEPSASAHPRPPLPPAAAAAAASSTPLPVPQANYAANGAVVSPFAEDADADLCVICQDELRDRASVKVLQCKHYFHVHCIDAWLERSLHCPMCMQEIPIIRFYENASPGEAPVAAGDASSTSGAGSSIPSGMRSDERATELTSIQSTTSPIIAEAVPSHAQNLTSRSSSSASSATSAPSHYSANHDYEVASFATSFRHNPDREHPDQTGEEASNVHNAPPIVLPSNSSAGPSANHSGSRTHRDLAQV